MTHTNFSPDENIQAVWKACSEFFVNLTEDEINQLESKAYQVFSLSDFVTSQIKLNPQLLMQLIESKRLDTPLSFEIMSTILAKKLSSVNSDLELKRVIREFRNEQMTAIYWRDLLDLATVKETCEQVSFLADVCLLQVNSYLHHEVHKQLVSNDSSCPLPEMLILGMGKLGGHELNVSSDIDLIFCYQNNDDRLLNPAVEPEKFYLRLGQRLIQALDERTAQGFVFRVDMRLRPYGDSGPLVMSYSAMEEYYQDQGRDWERFALIKARIITGEAAHKKQLSDLLKPFVFRRYIDFSVLESPRQMKKLIDQELRRKNLKNNIKLGPGGIREVEFIAQALQLIHGGKEKLLQCRSLFKSLPLLEELKLIPEGTASELMDCYLFLRKVEHRLQARKDQQTQLLPENPQEQSLLAKGLGYENWDGLLSKITESMAIIHHYFISQFQDANETSTLKAVSVVYQDIWNDDLMTPKSLNPLFEQGGFENNEQLAELIINFKSSSSIKNMGPRGAKRLDQLMPVILERISKIPRQTEALKRVLRLLSSVSRRTAYLELLAENNGALRQMIHLCSASARIADQIADYPYVLDELINPHTLFHPPQIDQLPDMLRQILCRLPEDDPEQQMDGMREFRQLNLLRITSADISGAMTVKQVSRHLTALAETIINAVVQLAWQQLVLKHGYPSWGEKERSAETVNHINIVQGFAVIAYGKLGGHELGYGSDLDLVFLHAATKGMTSGEKPVENAVFYMRLAQKIIHFLSIRTRSGVLYEVDMRLRPSGNSGLLVSHIDAFEDYQKTEAWTWEHQALIRSRCIFGDGFLSERFENIRSAMISYKRETKQLAKDVCDMRERMRKNLLPANFDNSLYFHLKQSSGGITDIEFLTQYLVLNLANTEPNLTISSNTAELLAFLSASQDNRLKQLIPLYDELRRLQNLNAIENKDNRIEADLIKDLDLSLVKELWSEYLDQQLTSS